MAKKRYTAEQINKMLREVEKLLGQGQTVIHAGIHIGVAEQAYYRWRKEYGGVKVDQEKSIRDDLRRLEQAKKRLADLEVPISRL